MVFSRLARADLSTVFPVLFLPGKMAGKNVMTPIRCDCPVGWPRFHGVKEHGSSSIILLFIRSWAQIAQGGSVRTETTSWHRVKLLLSYLQRRNVKGKPKFMNCPYCAVSTTRKRT